MKSYAAYTDTTIRNNSSSGGVFSLIADQYEVVYGVAMSEDCYSAYFTRVTNGDISKIRGSKYIQANVGNSYKNVKKDLETGKKVLFSGTGCQVSGLKAFLGKEYDNLLCIDVICHGVPSSKLWEKYVKQYEKKHGKLQSIDFRSKEKGWHEYGIKMNHIFIHRRKDIYMQMFLKNFCLRPSCYECFAKNLKLSDISLGDFWGIEKIASELDDDMGVSLVITRTKKGQMVFDAICNKLIWQEVNYRDAVTYNSAEYRSVFRPSSRNDFYKDMNILTFSQLKKKYLHKPLSYKVKNLIKEIIKKCRMKKR